MHTRAYMAVIETRYIFMNCPSIHREHKNLSSPSDNIFVIKKYYFRNFY